MAAEVVTRSAPGVEALDTPHCVPEITRATLSDIARANTLFGGRSAVAWGVDRLLEGTAAEVHTLLDVGAGMGDVAGWLERRRHRGPALRAFALDWHLEAARMCRERGLASVQGDAFRLPLADRSIDVVVASQLLHHFNRAAAAQLARELTRVARVGVVVGDLRRARVAVAGIWLAALALRFHAVSRRDGVTSVRRGYTARELEELLHDAGIAAAVTERPGFRVVATWRVHDADG
ncbi:MAG: methyltransferase domain-containing protein [Gemmatimonadota bacterium]|nr:MAG: methyltransferase domain-containing protein [Gemmatimonadota bacterium]